MLKVSLITKCLKPTSIQSSVINIRQHIDPDILYIEPPIWRISERDYEYINNKDEWCVDIKVIDGGFCNFISRKTQSVPGQISTMLKLGADNLRLFLGYPLPSEKNAYYDVAAAAIDDIIEKSNLHEYKQKRLLFETCGFSANNIDFVKSVLDNIQNKEHVGVLFDIVNVYKYSGMNLLRTIESFYVLEPYIKHVHIKGVEENPQTRPTIKPIKEAILEAMCSGITSYGIEYENHDNMPAHDALVRLTDTYKEFMDLI